MVSKPRNPALGEVAAGGDRLPVHAVLQDHAVVVNLEVSREATGSVAVASFGEPLVGLLERWTSREGKRTQAAATVFVSPGANPRRRIGRVFVEGDHSRATSMQLAT